MGRKKKHEDIISQIYNQITKIKIKNKRGYPILMVSGELSSILMNSNYNSWHKCETSSLDMQLSQAQGVSITIG